MVIKFVTNRIISKDKVKINFAVLYPLNINLDRPLIQFTSPLHIHIPIVNC